ncbi:MAG: hypothetical protein PQJ49_11115 [Sphaerochaetaceae bacterium]|nr:hypothetical protein [Sphaerochaetaceae bacterium]
MNKTIKRILITLLLVTLVAPSIFSQSATFSLVQGNKNTLDIYNEFGKKINVVSEDNIKVTGKVLIKAMDNALILNYDYGTIELAKNSLLIVDPFSEKPILYLVDGQLTFYSSVEEIKDYVISTPVSKYEFKSPAKIKVLSTENLEYGLFFEGEGTSYNSITGETTYLTSEQMIDMAYPNNFSLDIPEVIADDSVDFESEESIKIVSTSYIEKDNELTLKKRIASEEFRSNFLNDSYLMNIKPIQKSNDFEKYTTINFVITGNGQGNITALDFPAFSGLIQEAKANDQNILLIDGGNTLNGSPYVAFDKGKTAIKVLDKIGYDIFVPGAIDLSYGVDYLTKLNKSTNINFISTNAMTKDQLFYFNPFSLYLFDDFRIAVLGLSNPSDLTPLMDLDLTNQVLVENAQTAIDKAHEVADYVILISNLNYDMYDSAFIANNVDGIDLIIDSNNSDATMMSINGVPLISTGVGYSEIQNYTIKVKEHDVVSTRYAKVYSSNIFESDNRLLASLNIDSFDSDNELSSLINEVTIPSNLSFFLVPPTVQNVSVSTNDIQISSSTAEKKEAPKAPSFVDQGKEINKPTFVDDIKISTVEAPKAPTFVNESDKLVIPNAPIFNDSAKVTELVEVTATENLVSPPKFKPISFKVRKEEVIEEASEESLVEEIVLSEPRKANIYTGEDLKVKTHIGLDTYVTATADINDSSFTNNDYYGDVTIVPYISHGEYSLGLRLVGELDESLNFTYNLYPLPTTNAEISDYIISLIDHVSIKNPSESVDIQINRDEFEENTSSALSYDTLGGTHLHLDSVFDSQGFALNLSTSTLDIYDVINSTSEEFVSLNAVFKPLDLINLSIGTIGIGNASTLDIYPSFNLDFIPVNNKDINVNLNLGVTLYFAALPSFSFLTVFNPNNSNLVPNYLANASIDVNSETLKLSFGASYLVTEDSSKFTTNMIHKDTINSNIFTDVDSNTLSAILKVGYENDNMDFTAVYTLPMEMPTFEFGEDLIDLDLALYFNKFELGGYYLYNDFISNLKNITDIKAFLINSYTEYGAYITYNMDFFSVSSTVYLPSSTSAPLALDLCFNLKLDHTF